MPPESDTFKQEYDEFIEHLLLEDVFEDEVSARLDRDAFREVMTSEDVDPVDYSIDEEYAWRNHDGNFFEYKAVYSITAQNPLDKRKQLFEFQVEIVALYQSDRELTEELADAFLPNVKTNVWPYFREQVHDISKRFNMPDLIVPPFKVGSSVETE